MSSTDKEQIKRLAARVRELEQHRRDCHIMIRTIAHKVHDPVGTQALSLVHKQDPDFFNPLRGKNND